MGSGPVSSAMRSSSSRAEREERYTPPCTWWRCCSCSISCAGRCSELVSDTLARHLRGNEVEQLLELRQVLADERSSVFGAREGKLVANACRRAAIGLVPPGGL